MTVDRSASVRRSVALVWRSLRSMRTALVLLLVLAGGAVIGSLLPQIPNTPERVGRYLTDHELLGPLFFRAGFFDVYGSWWFVLITTLLFVSLAACLIPRTRALARSARQRPVQARELETFPQHRSFAVARPPGEVAAAAERLLRRRRFRVARDGTGVAAEKGILREAGSLLFHWAFVLLLVGVIVGKGTGFSGFAVVTEGETWVDALPNYDGRIRTGRYFGGDFTGIGVRLLDFEASYRRTGVPIDFVSRVAIEDRAGRSLGTREIRVNRPASIAGLRLFQSGFGWAPVVTASLDGERVWSSPVEMRRDDPPEGVSAEAMPWRAAIKLTAPEPDVMVTLELWPDFRAFAALRVTGRPVPMLVSFDPYLRFSVYEGTILDPSRGAIDPTGLRLVDRGALHASEGTSVEVPRVGELALAFPQLRQYSELLVGRDHGIPIVLSAAILVLVGLLPALYISRRKVWVRAQDVPTGSRVTIGGFALQRKDAFEEEFTRLARSLEGSGPPAVAPSEPVGAP
jgi:cytochrome c biogenesis protein